MNQKFAIIKNFKHCYLCVLSDGQTFLVWKLSQKQKQFFGQKINPFICFYKYNLCNLKLKRPHLTCLTCKLRKVVSAQNPIIQPIIIHQVWEYPNKSTLHKIIFKKLLSLAEALS